MLYSCASIFSEWHKPAQPYFLSLGVTTISMIPPYSLYGTEGDRKTCQQKTKYSFLENTFCSLQLTSWLYELKTELASEEVSDTLEGAERLIEQFSTQRDSTLDACASTIAEGKTLLEELK